MHKPSWGKCDLGHIGAYNPSNAAYTAVLHYLSMQLNGLYIKSKHCLYIAHKKCREQAVKPLGTRVALISESCRNDTNSVEIT